MEDMAGCVDAHALCYWFVYWVISALPECDDNLELAITIVSLRTNLVLAIPNVMLTVLGGSTRLFSVRGTVPTPLRRCCHRFCNLVSFHLCV